MTGNRNFTGLGVVVPVALFLGTLLVYSQVWRFGFIVIDDPFYVTRNAHVQSGLSLQNLAWSFTTFHDGNWIPFTWLSLMMDADLFGLRPGGFHLTNVVLHALNVVLLYFCLARATGQPLLGGLVAALFALHPLHVESVVWITERKDVLSTFFGLLSLWAYVRYATRHDRLSLAVSFIGFVCSLLSKQTLVTLPFVFLLLDEWPLCRTRGSAAPCALAAPGGSATTGQTPSLPTISTAKRSFVRLLVEKIPFLLVSGLFSSVTLVAQGQNAAIQNFAKFPFSARVENALVAYVAYLGKTFFPHDLAIFYPHPGTQVPLPAVCGAGALLAVVSAVAIVWRRRHPYLFVGWAWYLGTLVPMIGIVQVGGQQMADRYTYFPLIGVFIAVVWGAAWLVSAWAPIGARAFQDRRLPSSALRRRLLSSVALALLAVLSAMTSRQIGYWRDDTTLLRHALASAADSAFIRTKLGIALVEEQKPRDGIEQFEIAARLDPQSIDTQYCWAVALAGIGHTDEAAAHYAATLALTDWHAGAHNNLGAILGDRGELALAQQHLRRAIEISPDFAQAEMNLGFLCLKMGDFGGAIAHCQRALTLAPGLIDCHRAMAQALMAQGQRDQAARQLQYILSVSPTDAQAQAELERLMAPEHHSPRRF